MQFQQIRSATSIVTFAGKRFLIDPMLAKQGTYPAVPDTTSTGRGNPDCELPCPVEDLFNVDAVIVTHLHFDHFDDAAAELLPKQLTVFSQNEEEAKIVRYIFNRYCEGMGANNIAKELTKSKYKSPRGSDEWSDSTVRGIIKNEKYKGDVLQGKTFTIDPISHKRLSNMGEVDQYYTEDHHEAIISRELFDKAQKILATRRGTRETPCRRSR